MSTLGHARMFRQIANMPVIQAPKPEHQIMRYDSATARSAEAIASS